MLDDSKSSDKKLPIALKVAGCYLVIAGLAGVLLFFIQFFTGNSEFSAKSLGYKFGSFSRVAVYYGLLIISGLGIMFKKSWGRYLASFILAISIPFYAYECAWGFAHGRPSQQLYLMLLGVSFLWNGFWCLLILFSRPEKSR